MKEKSSYTEIIGSLKANPKSKVISHEPLFIDDKTGEKIKKDMEEVGIPGFCAAIITGKNQITPYPLGKDLEGNELDENSVFQAASLSKPVFAYLVLRLIASMEYKDSEGNAFNLDTRLDKIFSAEELEAKFEAGKDETNQIDETYKERFKTLTPRMLLSHTAGFPIGYNPSKLPPFQFEPNTEFCYSGPGIALLQGVVEKITASNLEYLAKKYVFEPCGMSTSTTFEWDEQTKQKKPHLTLKPDAANSLRTTASDYAKFAWQWMQDKTVIDAFEPPKDKKKFHRAENWLIDASWETDKKHESEHQAKLNHARAHLHCH